MAIVLGIDGGGSSTRVVLASETGLIIGRGAGGPSNIHSVGRARTAASLNEAVAMAWADASMDRREAESAVLGLAGLTQPDHREVISLIASELALARKVRVEHDLHIALAGGLAGESGIVLIAGTGSSCYARNQDGRSALVGGKGALAGDSGSAYWVAHRALRVAVKQMDGRHPKTRLGETVMAFLGAKHQSDFVSELRDLTTPEIARLCPRIIELSLDGDPAAEQIVLGAKLALADIVRTAASRSGLLEPKLILTGGLARARQFRDGLKQTLSGAVPGITFPGRILSPCGGAVLEALLDTGADVNAQTLKHLRVVEPEA